RLDYDRANDLMYCGIDFVAICGDADGDGDPSGTSAALQCLGGTDVPNLGAGESVCVMLDTNVDGTPDVIIGVPGTGTGFTAAAFVPGQPPAFAFGADLPANTGSLHGPINAMHTDFEFTIPAFSTLPGFALPDPQHQTIRFVISAFAGSTVDAGIADDLLNPSLVTLLCEGFDDLPPDTEVNVQYVREGLMIDGASHTGLLGVYTQPLDDPSPGDNPPVTFPNILRTKSTPTDTPGDEGRIRFRFVSPLDGTTPIGATVASLWLIDVQASGGGIPDGTVLQALDVDEQV